jgi:hypothetical protein
MLVVSCLDSTALIVGCSSLERAEIAKEICLARDRLTDQVGERPQFFSILMVATRRCLGGCRDYVRSSFRGLDLAPICPSGLPRLGSPAGSPLPDERCGAFTHIERLLQRLTLIVAWRVVAAIRRALC